MTAERAEERSPKQERDAYRREEASFVQDFLFETKFPHTSIFLKIRRIRDNPDQLSNIIHYRAA